VHEIVSQRRVLGLQAVPVKHGLVSLQPGVHSVSALHAHARGEQIDGAHSASAEHVLGWLLQMPHEGGLSGETQKVLLWQSALLEQHVGVGHGPNGQTGGREPFG